MSTYSITDIDGFSSVIRDGAAKSISENYTEDLDQFITIGQIKAFIVEKNLEVDADGLPMITEDIFDNIFEYIRTIIYQVGLAKLAANNHIECAWDSDTNQMIFWMESQTKGTVNIQSNPN